MAGRPTRRSPFASHRGAAAKRAMFGVAAAAILFMIISNSVRGGEVPNASSSASADPAAVESSMPVQAPDVAPAVADPMNPYRGVNAGAETSGTPAAPVDPAVYQSMLTTAQETAIAFGSYDYRQNPDEWAKDLPNLAPELRKRLTESAEQTWVGLRAEQVVAKSTLTGQNPQVVYYRDSAGEAQVVVPTTQQLSGVEGETTIGKSYAVTSKYDKESGDWVVTGLVGG